MNASYSSNLNDVARLVSGTPEGEAMPEAAPCRSPRTGRS